MASQEICTHEITLSIADTKIPCSVLKYEMQDKNIVDVLFSTVSPDILYLLTDDSEIFSLQVSTHALTKMVVRGLQSTRDMEALLCHNECIYITQFGGTVNKCAIEHSNTLRVISCYQHEYSLFQATCRYTISNTGLLYHSDDRNRLSVIDTSNMKLQSSGFLLSRHYIYGMAVRHDQIQVATDDGVYIYATDGTYTGQSYLNGEMCTSITCASNGYSIVGMDDKVAIVSSDLTSIYYISTTGMSCFRIRYNAADNSIVPILDDYCSFVIIPQEVYQAPFSLFSQCISTILLHVNSLPISLLPSRLKQLIQHYC